jgi:hypothetical protein
MKLSPEQLQALLAQNPALRAEGGPSPSPAPAEGALTTAAAPKRAPRQPRRQKGVPNRTEAAARVLIRSRHPGMEVRFEHTVFRLAHRCTYTVDFTVTDPASGRTVCYYECKGGFWRDDATVKAKMAAQLLDVPLYIIQKKRGAPWKIFQAPTLETFPLPLQPAPEGPPAAARRTRRGAPAKPKRPKTPTRPCTTSSKPCSFPPTPSA